MNLKVSTEPVATREVLLKMEPDTETIEKAMRKAARDISRIRPVPGFRPGKAPYAMVERIFGREVILDQALNDIAPQIYSQAIKDAGIEPIEQGKLEVESQDPVVLKANVPLVPVVELADYKSLHVDPEPDVTITEEQIDEQVQQLRQRNAQYETVERSAQMGDQLLASLKGTAEGEDVINQEDANIDILERVPPPGFAEALIGSAAGETREFSLTYPEDFENSSLAGKNVHFEVTAKAVRQVNLPAVDDDLAKMAGDYETLADLRGGLAENLKERLQNQARERETSAVIEALVDNSTIEYPAVALDREVEGLLSRQRANITRVGFTWENYLRMIGRTEQEMREQLRPTAEQNLRRYLVLREFARVENLTVEQGELANEVSTIASSFGERAASAQQQLLQSDALYSIYADVLVRKAAERATELLTGRAVPEETEVAAEAEDEPAAAAEDGSAEVPAVPDAAAESDEAGPEA